MASIGSGRRNSRIGRAGRQPAASAKASVEDWAKDWAKIVAGDVGRPALAFAGILRRGGGGDGEFRRMGGVEGEPGHAPDAEPRAKPVDEIGEIGRRALVLPDVEAIGLILVLALDFERGEADDVKAIAGVEGRAVIGGARGLEAFAKQPRDGGRFAQGPARGRLKTHDRAIDAKQAGLEPPRAFAMAREQAAEILRQRLDRGFDILALRQSIEEAPLGHEGRRLEARRDGRFRKAQQSVEARIKRGPATGGDGRAGAHQDIADAAQAGLGEGFQRRRIERQGGERQIAEAPGQRRRVERRRQDARLAPAAIAREGESRLRRRGQSRPREKPLSPAAAPRRRPEGAPRRRKDAPRR